MRRQVLSTAAVSLVTLFSLLAATSANEGKTKFFLRAMDAQMTFVCDEKGEVTGFVFEMGNRTMQAKKVSANGHKQ